MRRLRRQVIFLACWLIGIYSAEQLLEPMHISSFTYLFILVLLILVLMAPRSARIPLWALLTAPIPIFLAVKIWISPPLGTTAILLTVVEVCGIVFTTYLAYEVSISINEFDNAVAHITIDQAGQKTESTPQGVGIFYREVRRARNHQRPLALMAVAIEERSLRLNIDRIVEEAQLSMKKQYALTSVSRLLNDNLEDCDLIIQNNGHFLILLPETMPKDLPGLVERLRRYVLDQTGVELKIGSASLPQDSYTLEGLVDQASREMETDLASEFLINPKKVSVKQHVS